MRERERVLTLRIEEEFGERLDLVLIALDEASSERGQGAGAVARRETGRILRSERDVVRHGREGGGGERGGGGRRYS